MALTAIPGGLWIPLPPIYSVAAPTFNISSLLTIDASAEKAAFMFQVPKTGTLDKIEFRTGAVTFGGGSVLRASFQDIDLATGFPDGTQDQFRDVTGVAANTWTVPGLMTSDGTDTGTKRSVTVGGLLAVVIEYATFTAGDTVTWAQHQVQSTTGILPAFPTPALFTAAWAMNTAGYPSMALKYNDGSYAYIVDPLSPILTFNTRTFNSTSTPDERGMIFQFAGPVAVGGAWFRADLDAAADLVLYDSDGSTALQTVSLDSDLRSGTAGLNQFVRFADTNLTASTNYRLILKPTSASSVSLYDYDVSAAAHLDVCAGGQNFHSTTRTDAGAWTQTTTNRPWMGLLVTKIDNGAGGGGLLVHPGMSGGFRG